MSLLPANWQLPEEIRNRIGNRAGRQRAMSYDGHLLLVLHAPPASEETERQGRFICAIPMACGIPVTWGQACKPWVNMWISMTN